METPLFSTPSISRRTIALLLFAAMVAQCAVAGKEFVLPSPQPAKTYPASEEHSDESVTVAVDPYDMPDKANIFTVPYADLEMLPVYVIITNDGDQPITLNGMKAEFITSNRTKIAPATQDDLYRRLSKPKGMPQRHIPLPIPLPAGKPKGVVSAKVLDEMQRAQFSARAVEPHSTQAGFLFFDVSGIDTPLPGAHFYLTGLRNAKGDDLYYFEIALEKYLSAPQPQKPADPAKK